MSTIVSKISERALKGGNLALRLDDRSGHAGDPDFGFAA